MALKLVRAGETTSVWHKIFLYGNSGVGKTWKAVQVANPESDKKVLAILTEANAVQSARHANPNVLLPAWPLTRRTQIHLKNDKGEPRFRGGEPVMGWVNEPVLGPDGEPMVRHYAISIGEVREIITAVQNGEIENLYALVVDGYTEVQQLMKDAIMAKKAKLAAEARAKGEDPPADSNVFSLPNWGQLNEWMRRFLRTLRDLTVNVVGTALADVFIEVKGEVEIRHLRPMFDGKKIPNQAMSFHSVVAYCYQTSKLNGQGLREFTRPSMVEGPERYQCKPAHPLTGILDGPLWGWMEALERPPEGMVGRKASKKDLESIESSADEAQKLKAEAVAKEAAQDASKTADKSKAKPDAEKPKTAKDGPKKQSPSERRKAKKAKKDKADKAAKDAAQKLEEEKA